MEAGIIYSLISRGATVLCEYTNTSGNFTTYIFFFIVSITRRILEKIPPEDTMMSIVYDRYIFHYIVEDSITYMCMAAEEFGRRIPFAFLEDVKQKFQSQFRAQSKTALAYAMNDSFAPVLQNQMAIFSDPEQDKVRKMQGEIDTVRKVMISNIEKVLERSERIELLVEKADNLRDSAYQFQNSATRLRRHV